MCAQHSRGLLLLCQADEVSRMKMIKLAPKRTNVSEEVNIGVQNDCAHHPSRQHQVK